MDSEIVIVDYGMGNLRSVQKALESVGAEARIVSSPKEMEAPGMVLPGVGAFRDAMESLRRNGMVQPVLEHIRSGKPFLGVCLGLHLLFSIGEEFGVHQGLGIIPGRVIRFDGDLKVPHMGWNAVSILRGEGVLKDIEDGTYFYFVHSYYVVPEENGWTAATTDYGITFPSVVIRDNIFATQFHPEKSQRDGLRIYRNFASLVDGGLK